jgi:sterol desaturase/sphingolipid hydroxylase (fatty acid hydroxylase superfamily)
VLEVAAVVVLMDLAIWTQHLTFHHVPALWRLHRLHHADTEFDVTTGVRFHPIEIVLSMLIKIAVVVALGAPPEAVVLFEIILSASSLFEHANASFPPRLEKIIRAVLVTPDMHRIHHSVKVHETNSNFGFNFSIWDRLFGTYRAEPEGGRDALVIGIERFREPREIWMDRLMTQPFREGVDTVTPRPADQSVSRS